MIKKIKGLAILITVLITILIGCKKTSLAEPERELSRFTQKNQLEIKIGQNADKIIDINNMGRDIHKDTLFFSKNSIITQNNITYIDVTPFITLASAKEQDDARKMNIGRIKKNRITGKHNPIPMFTMNLNDSTYFVEYDDKNNNLIYVKDTPRENVIVDIPIQIIYKERIIMTSNKVYVPVTTLQKIINIKTATNLNRFRIETES